MTVKELREALEERLDDWPVYFDDSSYDKPGYAAELFPHIRRVDAQPGMVLLSERLAEPAISKKA